MQLKASFPFQEPFGEAIFACPIHSTATMLGRIPYHFLEK
jgi:hypothetical protein